MPKSNNLSFKKLYGGSDSDVFLFDFGFGKNVLKIYTFFTLNDVLAEIKIMNFLANKSFPVPHPVEFENRRQYFICGGRPAIIYPYMDGEIAGNFEITPQLCGEIGFLLSRLNSVLGSFNIKSLRNKKTYWDLMQFEKLMPFIKMLPAKHKKLNPIIKNIFLDYRIAKRKLKPLSKKLILNDVSETNILVKSGCLSGLVDFSDMVYAPRVCDVAIASAHLCFNDKNWPTKISALVKFYQKNNPIPQEELRILPILIRARVVALILGNCYQRKTRKGKKYFSIIDKNAKRLNFLSTISDDSMLSIF